MQEVGKAVVGQQGDGCGPVTAVMDFGVESTGGDKTLWGAGTSGKGPSPPGTSCPLRGRLWRKGPWEAERLGALVRLSVRTW